MSDIQLLWTEMSKCGMCSDFNEASNYYQRKINLQLVITKAAINQLSII